MKQLICFQTKQCSNLKNLKKKQVDKNEITDVEDYDKEINKAKSLVADAGIVGNRAEFVAKFLENGIDK